MATRLQRKLTVQLLQGSQYPAYPLLLAGLQSVLGVRDICRRVLVESCGSSGRGIGVRCRLRYGARCTIWLVAPATHRSSRSVFLGPLLTAVNRSGRQEHYSDTESAARHLAARCGGHVPTIERLLSAIERSRKKCLSVVEEQTRWR